MLSFDEIKKNKDKIDAFVDLFKKFFGLENRIVKWSFSQGDYPQSSDKGFIEIYEETPNEYVKIRFWARINHLF